MGRKNKNKKRKNTTPVVKPVVEVSSVVETEIAETKAVETKIKSVEKKKIKKEKKENKLVRRLKETGSELKKVTWPKFPKVVKQTGVVLAVVVFFGLVLFGIDYLLKFLFQLLIG